MGSKRVVCKKAAVSRYSTELDVPAPPAGELLSEISDPASFTDIAGHILLPKTRSSGATGTPGYLPGRLDVVYAYPPWQRCQSSLRVDGGDLSSQRGASYMGGTYVGTLTWEVATRLYPAGGRTRLPLSVVALWRAPSGCLGGESAVDIQGLIEHIVMWSPISVHTPGSLV